MGSKRRSSFFNETRNAVLAHDAGVARNIFQRMKGLLGRKSLEPGEGLYIVPCNSIHMIGMKFPLDAVFIDRKGVVVGLLEDFAPGRISGIFFGAHGCLELPAGTIKKTATRIGDHVISREGGKTDSKAASS